MISMGNALKNILIVCFIAAIWLALEALDHELLDLPLISESSYFIYWLSGLRLVAVILFGWLGFCGLFLGYAVSSIYIWGGSDSDALILGFLLSIAQASYAGKPFLVSDVIFANQIGSPATLSRRLNSLVEKELIVYAIGNDSRKKFLELTPKSKKYFAKLEELILMAGSKRSKS